MRNIIRFILKHNLVFLFLLFETVSFFLLISYNHHHIQTFINSSGRFAAGIMKISGTFTEYFSLKTANEELSRENALLRTQLPGNFLVEDSFSFDYSNPDLGVNYIYRPAKVINNTVNKFHNYLTLNKGSKHGIEPGMGVITARGLVGVVRHSSANYSSVMSLLNTQLKVSASLRESNHFGSLEWDGRSPQYVYLHEIPSHAPLTIGDAVVTSGYSSIFPPNILIGIIEDYELNEGEGCYEIKVKLSTDFTNLSYVEVVEVPAKDEVHELEKLTSDD